MSNWDSMSSTAKRDAHEVAVSFDVLRHDLADWAHNVASYFDESRANVARWAHDVQAWADSVVRWFQAFPGRIAAGMALLGPMMFSAGRNAIARLLDGIKSMIGEVGSVVSSIASKVAGFFGLSPAKEGPLAGGGAPEVRGQHFAADLARGMLLRQAAVAQAARQLAQSMELSVLHELHLDHLAHLATLSAPSGGSSGPAASGGITIEFNVSGAAAQLGPEFWRQFQEDVRAKGGDPRIVTKKVKFA
jgi:hypothetical protein